MSHWIRVKDALPAPYLSVLIYSPLMRFAVGYLKKDGNFYLNEKKEAHDGEITHWMPMPSAPLEDKMTIMEAMNYKPTY